MTTVAPQEKMHLFLREIHAGQHEIVLARSECAGDWSRMDAAANEMVNNWRAADICRLGLAQCERAPMDADFRVVIRNSLTEHGLRALDALDNGFVWMTDCATRCEIRTRHWWQGLLSHSAISDETFQRALNLKAPELKEIRNAFVERKLRSVRNGSNKWIVQ